MSDMAQERKLSSIGPMIFRIALFASAVTLAIYIPYKYATQYHAMSGLYAFLFPLSIVLVLAGIVLAVKPQTSCNCGMVTRSGVASIAVVWIATGLLCAPLLLRMMEQSVWGGTIATIHMSVQHIFLSSVILAFAFAPQWMTRKLGVAVPDFAAAGTMANKSIPA